MTTSQQSGTHAAPPEPKTERVLHDFVRDTVSSLSRVVPNGSAPEFGDELRMERGPDGHFRQRYRRIRILPPMQGEEWLCSLPDYRTCVDSLESNAVIGPHLDRLVGTSLSASRLEARNIVASLVYAMLDDEGRLAFSTEKFERKWKELEDFFSAEQIAYKMVAPLPNLAVSTFPLRLNDELVLDRLTEDEVSHCYQVGVLQPNSLRFPMIYSDAAVGIRRTTFLPKIIRRGDEPFVSFETGDEGDFGRRPLFRDDLVIDDVLSAIRLFKHTQIRTSGMAKWTDFPWLRHGIEYRALGQWPYGRRFELSEGDVPNFLELWQTLERGAAHIGFSIRRFNLAFERRLLADRIVDLVIAAEALFLEAVFRIPERACLQPRICMRFAAMTGR